MPRTIFLVLTLIAPLFAQSRSAVLESPDHRLAITFQNDAKRQLTWAVTFNGKPLIEPSAFSLELEGEAPLGPGMTIVSDTPSSTDETWRPVTGKTSTVRNHYNAVRIELEEQAGRSRRLAIEARAYDDAVAFRYIVPDQTPLRELRLKQEHTEFRISRDAIAWALELPGFRTPYESEYVKLPVSALANQASSQGPLLVGLPLLMNVQGVGWMAITEADLRDNSSLYLVNPDPSWGSHRLESRLAPRVDNPDLVVQAAIPHNSAWRVLLVGDRPGALIESNTIQNLNPPSAIQDTSWIHAGRSAWNWWNGSIGPGDKPAFNDATMRSFVDFAAKSGFEYMLVDAGWAEGTDITKMNGRVDIPALVRYAAPKNVRVWIWMHWTSLDRQMEEAFPLYEKWGVAGIKTDFMNRDDQQMMGFYYRVAENAARHHLMVDFHGATKPSGLERTWPNVLGYEAVMGMEYSKGTARDNPDHHLTLPFTRMLTGRMDYTPGGFENVTRDAFEPRGVKPMVQGTRAHQLAMYAVYESPFQMVSDRPQAYEDQPSFEFIRNVPATWDETRVLNGEPGEYVTIARRRGREWFLGSMTNWTPRQLDLPLTFLGPGRYRAEIYADAEDADRFPKNVRVLKQEVGSGEHLKAELAPGGGYAVRFVPLNH